MSSPAAKRDHVEFLLDLFGEPRWLQDGNPYAHQHWACGGRNQARRAKVRLGQETAQGTGRGFAFHFSHAGHFAEVAELSVDSKKKITFHQLTVVGDIGPMVNLSGAENQCEGAALDGLSTMLGLEVGIENGEVQTTFPLPDAEKTGQFRRSKCFYPDRCIANRCRRAGSAADRTCDRQRNLRGNGRARSHAATAEIWIQHLVLLRVESRAVRVRPSLIGGDRRKKGVGDCRQQTITSIIPVRDLVKRLRKPFNEYWVVNVNRTRRLIMMLLMAPFVTCTAKRMSISSSGVSARPLLRSARDEFYRSTVSRNITEGAQ